MKSLLFSYFLLIFLLHQVNAQEMTYVISSSGLNIPALEGGRTELEFADINQDGHIDILSIGDHGSPFINTGEHGIMVWFGDGTGNWTVHQEGNFGYGGIAVGDVNNDGFLDVGYGMHHNYSSTDFGDQLIEVALGDGTGTNWTPWDDGLATNGETWGMFGTDFADVNNDGFLDIGSISFGSGAGVHVYLNQANGTWLQSFGFLGGNSTMIFEFGDIDNDTYPDFVVTHQSGTVFLNNEGGKFENFDYNLPGTSTLGRIGVSLGDVTNFGFLAIAFINGDGGIEVWTFVGWGLYEWVNHSTNLPTQGDYQVTQLCDMNMDGWVDLMAFGEGLFTLWLNQGDGNWIQDAQFTTPPNEGEFKAFRVGGDVDHNGFPDIIFVAEEGDWLNYQNHLYCYRENSEPTELTIKPVYPSPGANLPTEGITNIKWHSAVPNNVPSKVKLEFRGWDTAGPWDLIADSLPNNGCYQWNVPYISHNAIPYFMKYTVYTISDTAFVFSPAFFIDHVVDIEEHEKENVLKLNCYPNPAFSEVNISFNTGNWQPVVIEILDLIGKVVFRTEITNPENEWNKFTWNGCDQQFNKVSEGTYIVRLTTDQTTITRKIILLR